MNKLVWITLLASFCLSNTLTAKTTATRNLERLDRGVIALPTADNKAFVSWRLLADDKTDVAFNVYKQASNGQAAKLTPTPLTNVTNLIDPSPVAGAIYLVKPVIKGKETNQGMGQATLQAKPYLSIPLQTPDRYSPGDCSAADLDGDGAYEIIVHMVGIARDNAHAGLTTPPIFHAYKLDGTLLWSINLGYNIREGAHYTQFLVYDFDGDGKAELICKTADGTIDGTGKVLGDPKADWRVKPADGNLDPWAFRGSNRSRPTPNDAARPATSPLVGRIMEGPEYLTVFEGTTGKALATVDYVPGRGEPGLWGDNGGNRGERYLAGVAYLDGKHPSAVMCRGYYTRATLAAWDWRDGKLTLRWFFDSYDGTPGNAAYSGQGNHSLSVADVDNDGCDEIIYGACAIDNNGKGLYSTGFGHGDALHCADLDPERPGLEVFQVHENIRVSADVAAGHMRDARTGERLWGLPATEDVGRGMSADIDPRHPGNECWSIASGGLYSAKGERITTKRPRSCNFAAWWDGDLLRELLDRNTISKWDYTQETDVVLFRADSCTSI
ncbi:MAG: rhamnogalacturonan lyase, partial [Bacteroidales bacterium]|nr:rhamnogalacturonan lyase [Bacteroidales bacterium]